MGDFPLFPQGKDPAAPYVPSSPEKKNTHSHAYYSHTVYGAAACLYMVVILYKSDMLYYGL